jgi:hypothetical protein
VPAVKGYAATVTDDEALTMRLTVIGGQHYAVPADTAKNKDRDM